MSGYVFREIVFAKGMLKLSSIFIILHTTLKLKLNLIYQTLNKNKKFSAIITFFSHLSSRIFSVERYDKNLF